MIKKRLLFILSVVLVATACKPAFEVTNVDYSQQLETVLQPGADGMVEDTRHGIRFNILPFQYKEFKDSSSVQVEQVRLIRNAAGYYFITANNFKNVYVMEPEENKLVQKKTIEITGDSFSNPAFNLRSPYVQLVFEDSPYVYHLTQDGIQSVEKEEEES